MIQRHEEFYERVGGGGRGEPVAARELEATKDLALSLA
jgi:hypothetical protein